jgi:hypothetical protein
VRQPHATDDRGLHRVVFLALLTLRLATTPDRAAGTTERASGATTLAGTATAATGATAAWPAAEATGTTGRSTCSAAACAAAAVVTATAGTTGTTAATWACTGSTTAGTGSRATGSTWRAWPGTGWARGHVAGGSPGPRSATGARTAAGTRRGAGSRPRGRTLDRLLGRERVVADTRGPRGGLGCTGNRAGPGTGGRTCGACGSRRLRRGRSRGLWRGRSRSDNGCGSLRCRRRSGRRGLRTGGLGRTRGRPGRRRRRRTVTFGLCRLAAAECLAQAARDGRLHSGGRRLYEFALFTKSGEHFLAGDTEFFGQLVYTGLTCHYISSLGGTAVVGRASVQL